MAVPIPLGKDEKDRQKIDDITCRFIIGGTLAQAEIASSVKAKVARGWKAFECMAHLKELEVAARKLRRLIA